MNDTPSFQIGECPKCGKNTFVVYEHTKEGKISWTKPVVSPRKIIKGQCYSCGEIREISY